jgi:hypothetical protein
VEKISRGFEKGPAQRNHTQLLAKESDAIAAHPANYDLTREEIEMLSNPPPVNPDVHAIADRAKHGFYTASKLLADVQYRLAELAGTGQLDVDESHGLQDTVVRAWEELYRGTLCAVRDRVTAYPTPCDPENTYSDGRTVRTRIRLKGWQELESGWEHNNYLYGDGPVAEYPRGTVSYISSVDAEDGQIFADPPEISAPDLTALRLRLRLRRGNWGGGTGKTHGEDGIS